MVAGFLGYLFKNGAGHGIDHLLGEHGESLLHVLFFLHGQLPHLAFGHIIAQGLLQRDQHGRIGMGRGVDKGVEGAKIGALVVIEKARHIFPNFARQPFENLFAGGILVDLGGLKIEIHEIFLGMNRLFQGFLQLEFLGHAHLLSTGG